MTSCAVGAPIEIGECTVLPVVEIHAAAYASEGACWMLGSSVPVAIVLVEAGTTHASQASSGS